jgi:hypothetical protein
MLGYSTVWAREWMVVDLYCGLVLCTFECRPGLVGQGMVIGGGDGGGWMNMKAVFGERLDSG